MLLLPASFTCWNQYLHRACADRLVGFLLLIIEEFGARSAAVDQRSDTIVASVSNQRPRSALSGKVELFTPRNDRADCQRAA